MDRIYNFSAGPAMIPEEVVRRAREELFSLENGGISVMEFGHKSEEYKSLMNGTKDKLRKLLGIPMNYKVLFWEGEPSMQFSAIPLNLLSEHKCADYILTGQLSYRAMREAKKYGDIAIAASSAGSLSAYSSVPETEKSDFRPDADYVYLCYNNTIYGTKFNYIPETNNIPLVADMTTAFLTEPIDVSRFGLIYAGSKTSMSACGLTVVIIREDLIGNARPDTPSALNYAALLEDNAFYGAPEPYSLYMAALTFDWLLSLGGLEEIKRRNERKASILYDYLDGQPDTYYTSPVDKKCRSMVNIVFTTGDKEKDKKFAAEARERGLYNLEGHESVGGLRACIYNSMPVEGVSQLVNFMKRFALENPRI